MRTLSQKDGVRTAVGLAVFAMLLGACRPKSPDTPPAPVPQPPEIAAQAQTSAAGPAELQSDAGATSLPTRNTASGESDVPKQMQAGKASAAPALDGMQLAKAGSKLGVPVDLRYQFDAAVEPGRPATLHLAAVPRVEGSNLSVRIKETPGIEAFAAPLTAQKASASQAYRQQLTVTRHANAPAELRVLVTMDVAEGSAFSYFSVPFGDASAARKAR